MIVILRPEASQEAVRLLMEQIRSQGVEIHYSRGTQETILGLVGDTTHVDEDWLRASGVVADVRRCPSPTSWPTDASIRRTRGWTRAAGRSARARSR